MLRCRLPGQPAVVGSKVVDATAAVVSSQSAGADTDSPTRVF
jgi:hypothetical protein